MTVDNGDGSKIEYKFDDSGERSTETTETKSDGSTITTKYNDDNSVMSEELSFNNGSSAVIHYSDGKANSGTMTKDGVTYTFTQGEDSVKICNGNETIEYLNSSIDNIINMHIDCIEILFNSDTDSKPTVDSVMAELGTPKDITLEGGLKIHGYDATTWNDVINNHSGDFKGKTINRGITEDNAKAAIKRYLGA